MLLLGMITFLLSYELESSWSFSTSRRSSRSVRSLSGSYSGFSSGETSFPSIINLKRHMYGSWICFSIIKVLINKTSIVKIWYPRPGINVKQSSSIIESPSTVYSLPFPAIPSPAIPSLATLPTAPNPAALSTAVHQGVSYPKTIAYPSSQ